ncbi:GIY-YIG nuclease family protein [Paenibacillus sp. TY11]|uniref:GIY-YIG nuclease family protein n=1 Tax=Paenibacillus sp. TY11 TaxID=3448633 RepID=UPI004039C8C2
MDSCESSSDYSYVEYDTEYKSLQKYHSENPFVRNLITERLYELRILLKQHITREKQDHTVYALKLEHDCFYVGTSTQIDKRIKNHCKGKGAVWTQLHRPKELVRKLPLRVCDLPTAEHAENLMTIEFMRLYGWNRVRGGFFVKLMRIALYTPLRHTLSGLILIFYLQLSSSYRCPKRRNGAKLMLSAPLLHIVEMYWVE